MEHTSNMGFSSKVVDWIYSLQFVAAHIVLLWLFVSGSQLPYEQWFFLVSLLAPFWIFVGFWLVWRVFLSNCLSKTTILAR